MLLYGDAFIDGDTRIKGDLSLDNALGINYGGTGATNAAGARANLEITPASIGAKATQSAVSSPTASGTAAAFIDTISQNAQGVITATKKSVTPASIGAAPEIQVKAVKDTPSSKGSISLNLSAGSYVVVSAKAPGLIVTPWVNSQNSNWNARVTSTSGDAYTSEVTVTVYYQKI